MLRLVFRPLLVLLTLGALVVALLQVSGRIAVHLLDRMEPLVNQLLASRGIQVSGLSGDWRLLNPIIRAEQVTFPAGHLAGFTLELDMAASALRGVALARRLRVLDAQVAFEKPAGGPWRLVGGDAGPLPDVLPLLRHSDQLEFAGTLVLTREGGSPVALDLTYLGINRGGEHRHSLSLVNAEQPCADSCGLQADLYSQARLWPLRPARTRLTVASGDFLLPKDLLGVSSLKLADVDVNWQQHERESGGTLRLAAEQFDLPGERTLAVRLEGAVRGRDAAHRGVVSALQVREGDRVWDLPPVALHANASGMSLWMAELDLARTSTFLRRALAGLEPAERWLRNLNLRGRGHNLRAHVPFDGRGLAYAVTVDGLAMDGYRGAPRVANGSGELFGFERGAQLNLNAQDLALAFPDLFADGWSLPYAQGVLQAWFRRGYLGLRGLNLRSEVLGSRVAGSFVLSRPNEALEQRLALSLSVDRLGVAEARQFVPQRLNPGLRDWLTRAPLDGTLSDGRLAYQGQIRRQPGAPVRRLELAAQVSEGRVRYHPDWPEVSDIDGDIAVMGSQVEVAMARGRSAGAELVDSRVRVLDRGAAAELFLDANLQADQALALVRTTPLSNWLGFVEPDWRAAGPLRLSGELLIPLGRQATPAASGAPDEPQRPPDDLRRPLDVRLQADLEGVALELPRYRTSLEALRGTVRYRHPYDLSASGVRGTLFDHPVVIGASSTPGRVNLRFMGRADSADVWQLLGLEERALAAGSFDFQAQLAIPAGAGGVAELQVTSPLEGLALTLPGGYDKTADVAEPVELNLSLGAAVRRASFGYRDLAGWLEFGDGPLRGALGFGTPPPTLAAEAQELVIGGRVARLALADLGGQATGAAAAGLPRLAIRLDDLEIGELALGAWPLTAATVRGAIDRDGFDVALSSREVRGAFSGGTRGPIQVQLHEVILPPPRESEHSRRAAGGAAADPLDPGLIARLPAADVEVHRLMRGEQDYGSWRFQMRPEAGVLHLRELEADVRGLRIAAPDGLRWHGDSNETHFEGTLAVDDLATVLPQWGYAPTIETDSAAAEASVRWSGSPAAVDVLALRGRADVRAQEGRFLDADAAAAGAQRIFSLLNFTTIAKRMTLNFSDVFGRGVSFDRLKSTVGFDEGVLEFVEPLQVEGTGSSFRITGTVDLRERVLNNEMVVTLPVSKGLPWYAAYVALANPLAGLGMLVGERVLRKPLEQFSSANYRIGGTVDDPEVKFVSVFDVPVTEPPAPPPDESGSGGGEAAADAQAPGDAEQFRQTVGDIPDE